MHSNMVRSSFDDRYPRRNGMRLIKTHDGLIGLDFDPNCTIIWCDTVEQAIPIAHCNFHHLGEQGPTREEMDRDIRYALDVMAQKNDDIAEFGVLGSFMYSSKTDEASGY